MPKSSLTPSGVREILQRVAIKSMTYRFYHWDWGESINIEGLWRTYEVTAERRFAEFVQRMIDGWISHSPDPWYPDHVGPGSVLVSLWQETGDWRLLAYAKRLADFLANLPRNSFGGYFHRPDLPDRSKMIWVDSMQTDAPFLCHLGLATGETRWFDAGADHIIGHVKALQDPDSGLFNHAYDDGCKRTNGTFWGRGNGWAFLGLVYTLKSLPKESPGYSVILRSLESLAESLKSWQDAKTHLWHTVINHFDTYLEASASLMIAEGFLQAVQHGLIPKTYGSVGASAWEALWDQVNRDGVVQNVSARCPAANNAEAYNHRPVGGHWPWGQGAYQLAATSYWECAR